MKKKREIKIKKIEKKENDEQKLNKTLSSKRKK